MGSGYIRGALDCGSLNVVGFECSGCVHGNTLEAAEVKKEIELHGDRNVECVEKFCYLGNMMGSGGRGRKGIKSKSAVCVGQV